MTKIPREKYVLSQHDFVILNKWHGPCYNNSIHDGIIFTSHRNAFDQLCSIQELKSIKDQINNKHDILRYCKKMLNNYKTCLNHPNLVYDMDYHVMISNIEKIIDDISIIDILNITPCYQ